MSAADTMFGFSGEDLVAAARQMPAGEWHVWIESGEVITVADAAAVTAIFDLIARLYALLHAGSYEREDPETGEPLPPGVSGYPLGHAAQVAAGV